ncbi:response regulator [Flavobacterium amniphilum]|uniref:response regulator n=1 Tax=Flavobacterium amniphilum TaxID=1834035 RepID=UPI00202A4E91|nr:response regulator [Flavobacterium amniphilum]MCL9805026.1 response regulator [Flavobacterium amniphilum]
MNELKLLIVEDDPELITSYKRDIASFNLDSEVKINHEQVSDKEAALNILKDKKKYFDAAIVDLKLDSNEKSDDDYSGNDVIREIKSNLRFPVFVVTGTPQHISEDLKNENSFFKIKTRGEEDNHLEQLVDIYKTGITKIINSKGHIEDFLNNIFWNHLSNSMENWIKDDSRSPEEKQKSLLRYTLMHMQEYIDEDIEKYHPSEFYITEPIKKNIFTGDIVTYDGNRYIVLTPSCDIVIREDGSRNTTMILLVQIRSLNDVVKNFDSLNSGTSEKNDNRVRLNSFIENKKQNYHFIPKTNIVEAGLVDFQNKLTLPESNINKLIEERQIIRIATVSTPFLKDIISRYSNYYSRQGSPDFDTNEIYTSLFE